MTRLPAGDPARRIGALLFNCGGPGCPAVGFLHEVGTLLFPEETRARFDLVGFDPRGMGESGQIDCQLDWDAYYALDPSPDDAAEREAWLAGGRDYAAACAANGGDVLPFMGTENVVSDMERLREALGEETISFLGLSYGTSLGARYADRYPERVRAFALDSALPSFVDPSTFVPEWVDGIERAFDAFLADCAAALTCAFHSGGDPGAAFDALMAQVDATPLEVATDTGTRLVGQHAVLDAVDVTLSKPARWPQLAAALAAAAGGDGAPVLALADQRNERTARRQLRPRQRDVPGRQLPGLPDRPGSGRLRGAGREGGDDRPPPRRLLRDLGPALRLLAGAGDAGRPCTRRRRRAADPGDRRHPRHPGRLPVVGGHGRPAGVRASC